MLLGLTILALWIYVVFNVKAIKSLGQIPYCQSDYYYALDQKGIIFVVVLFMQAILLACPLLYIPWTLSGSIFIKLTVWICGLAQLIGIVMVSSAPEFKTSKSQYAIHFAGSILAMIGSQVYVFFAFPWAYLGWVPIAGWKLATVIHRHTTGCSHWDIELLDSSDWLFFAEVGMFLTTYITLIACLV